MENNSNIENQQGIDNTSNPLNLEKTNSIEEDTLENTPLEETEEIEKIQETEENSKNFNPNEENPITDLYNFYKSKHQNRHNVTYVNTLTVTLFIIFICMCLIIFISCMVIDFSNPNLESSSLGDSYINQLLDSNSTNYDFSQNEGIIINQYNPPEREDSIYLNEDGTYTVAGVSKYASDSIIAIYTSNDGQTLNGMGSGIVFSDEGYILTNAHVIQGANIIVGVVNDETNINLSLVGMNTDLDIAVLQSDNKDIPVATMGNSDKVLVGEQVVAIGNPAGLNGTVTSGIVSSINRNYTTSNNVQRAFIQTDTAISPGNSGGALLNMYGQVIGITSLKISENQTYEGLGFAICINDALECAEDLIKNRFRIGIIFSSYTGELVINEVSEGTSIAQTELQSGDIIKELNGMEVYDYGTIMTALEGSKPGDTITAKVQRRNNGLINEFYIEFQLMPYDS